MPDQTSDLIEYVHFWLPDISRVTISSVLTYTGKWLEAKEAKDAGKE